jgi:uncharacterized protein YbdZ (MbtH family)
MFKVVTWHGEATSLYFVVRLDPEPDGWEVVEMFHSKPEAEDWIRLLKEVV